MKIDYPRVWLKCWLFFSFFLNFHLQDAECVERLNETGELRKMLKPYKVSIVKLSLRRAEKSEVLTLLVILKESFRNLIESSGILKWISCFRNLLCPLIRCMAVFSSFQSLHSEIVLTKYSFQGRVSCQPFLKVKYFFVRKISIAQFKIQLWAKKRTFS
jgi:hypothetical protein